MGIQWISSDSSFEFLAPRFRGDDGEVFSFRTVDVVEKFDSAFVRMTVFAVDSLQKATMKLAQQIGIHLGTERYRTVLRNFIARFNACTVPAWMSKKTDVHTYGHTDFKRVFTARAEKW